MITPNTAIAPTIKAQDGLIQYLRSIRTFQNLNVNTNFRYYFENIDRAYMREQDYTKENLRAKFANRYGDATKFQNVTVPVVMPQVEAAVTYQASVFLTGQPLFGVVSNPANMDAARAMEAVIDEQAIRGGWVNEFMLAFRDAFKYNFFALEVEWDRVATATLDTDLRQDTKNGTVKQTIWEGNVIRRRDPYNTIWDTRVHPTKIHEDGEFVGYTELMSRVKLKDFIGKLQNKIVSNVVNAFQSQPSTSLGTIMSPTSAYYIPQLNPEILQQDAILNTGFNWMSWAGLSEFTEIDYKDMYVVTTLYARIIPADFDMSVPNKQTPQIWKFIYVNDTVLIYAERKTNAHAFLPILCGQGLDDGLGYQTKSLATNVIPFQQLQSALWNSSVAASRRAISDRALYDPSRISEAQINNPNPAAKMPVRPAAYGKPVSEAVYPFPFRDDQSQLIIAKAQQLDMMANKISRQNPVRQGQFVKGNKTRSEFQEVMQNADGGDQMIAMYLESKLFTPLKEILKLNILQFQPATQLFSRSQKQVVNIDPVALRQMVLTFKVSDGLVPSDKIISADAIRDSLQAIANIPAIGQSYNLAGLFSYFVKTQGADIEEFEKSQAQVAYETAVQQWQQLCIELAKQNPNITTFPPQPVPQQFGYDPQQNQAQQGAAVQQQQTQQIPNLQAALAATSASQGQPQLQ
jgi:hypothetical protein